MNTRILILPLILAAAFAGGFYLSNWGPNEHKPDIAGLLWPDPNSIGEFKLASTRGGDFTDAQLLNHWTLVFFGFTNCPDVCPTTLATLSEVYKAAQAGTNLAKKLRVLFVSIDPERDSLENLRSYVEYFNPEFVGASGDAEALKQLTSQLGILALKVDIPGQAYTMDHTASVLLIDPKARFVSIFSAPHIATEITDRLAKIVDFIGRS